MKKIHSTRQAAIKALKAAGYRYDKKAQTWECGSFFNCTTAKITDAYGLIIIVITE